MSCIGISSAFYCCGQLNFLQLGEAVFSRDFNHVEDMSTLLDVFFVCCVEILDELYHWEEQEEVEEEEEESDCGRSRGMDTAVDQARILQDVDSTIHSHSRSHSHRDTDTFLSPGQSEISDSSHTDTARNTDTDKNRDSPLLPTILCQCMHTLRCVLMLDVGFLKNRHLPAEAVVKYNLLLTEVLAKWSVEMTAERSQSTHHAPSQPLHASDPHRQPQRKAILLRGHVSYYSTLMADTLMCTKCALQLMAHDSGTRSLHTPPNSLYIWSVCIGIFCAQQDPSQQGPPQTHTFS